MDLSARLNNLRSPGYRRSVIIRRAVAVFLVVAAVLHVLIDASRSDPPALTFARDVAPGTVLTSDDLELRRLPAESVPDNALDDAALAEGQLLAAAASRGEVVTATRLVGPDLAGLLTQDMPDGEEFSMVPVPLAEPDILPMLHHGTVVDVVSQGPRVVAENGIVVTSGEGDAVLVLLRQGEAAAVAAASLSEPLTLVLSNRQRQFNIPNHASRI